MLPKVCFKALIHQRCLTVMWAFYEAPDGHLVGFPRLNFKTKRNVNPFKKDEKRLHRCSWEHIGALTAPLRLRLDWRWTR